VVVIHWVVQLPVVAEIGVLLGLFLAIHRGTGTVDAFWQGPTASRTTENAEYPGHKFLLVVVAKVVVLEGCCHEQYYPTCSRVPASRHFAVGNEI
jgi:hypothetical protein